MPLSHTLRRRAFACALTLAALFSGGWTWAKTCPPPFAAPTPQQLATAAREAKDRGFLWTIEKDGRVSHLYGTLHVGKLDWALPGPRLAQALRSSKAVAMELDVSDPKVLERLREQIVAPDAEPLPVQLQQRLRDAADTLCVEWNEIADQRPEFQLTALMLALARYDALEPAYGSEVSLAGIAHQLKLPTHSLESADEQVQALSANTAAERAEWVATGLRDLQSDKGRRVMRALADAWARNDLKRLQNYSDWCECMDTPAERAMSERMVDGRNQVLAERIAALHAKEGPLLAAVGALHMTGPTGLPALLQARGFTVKQVF